MWRERAHAQLHQRVLGARSRAGVPPCAPPRTRAPPAGTRRRRARTRTGRGTPASKPLSKIFWISTGVTSEVDGHAQRDDHGEPETSAELGALADPAAQHRPGALQLLGDGDLVVVGARAASSSATALILASSSLVGVDDRGVPGHRARAAPRAVPVASTTARPRGRSRGRRVGSSTAGRRPRSASFEARGGAPPRMSASIDRVDRRGRVVQDQDAGRPHDRPGQRHALALARPRACGRARRPRCRTRLRERADEPVGRGDPRGGLDRRRRRRRSRARCSRARSSRTGSSPGTRSRWSRRSASGVRVAEVDPADRDRALVGIGEPHQQLGQRALADAGRAHDRDRLRGGHLERDTVEDRLVVVAAPHAADRRSPSGPSGSPCGCAGGVTVTCSSNTVCSRSQPTTARGSSARIQPMNRIGHDEQSEQRDEPDEFAERDRARSRPATSPPRQEQRGREGRQGIERRPRTWRARTRPPTRWSRSAVARSRSRVGLGRPRVRGSSRRGRRRSIRARPRRPRRSLPGRCGPGLPSAGEAPVHQRERREHHEPDEREPDVGR